jgi:hypothetical protein
MKRTPNDSRELQRDQEVRLPALQAALLPTLLPQVKKKEKQKVLQKEEEVGPPLPVVVVVLILLHRILLDPHSAQDLDLDLHSQEGKIDLEVARFLGLYPTQDQDLLMAPEEDVFVEDPDHLVVLDHLPKSKAVEGLEQTEAVFKRQEDEVPPYTEVGDILLPLPRLSSRSWSQICHSIFLKNMWKKYWVSLEKLLQFK